MSETTLPHGAVREGEKPRFRLIPWLALRRIAEAYSEGARKYQDEVGRQNWKKGSATFAWNCFDHAIDHLYAWVSGDRSEDHLGHAAANLCFIMWFEARGLVRPITDDEQLAPAPAPKPEDIANDCPNWLKLGL